MLRNVIIVHLCYFVLAYIANCKYVCYIPFDWNWNDEFYCHSLSVQLNDGNIKANKRKP